MIIIEETETWGWRGAIRGMRNPMNSWAKMDSTFTPLEIGKNDMKLMKILLRGGGDERKFLRMIHVQMDVTAPLYWWKEYDTYKVGTVANSCSTMHKLTDKEFDMDDFSVEHLERITLSHIGEGIDRINDWRERYIEEDSKARECRRKCDAEGTLKHLKAAKHYWWQIVQILPSSYNQKRTLDLNYEVLLRIYPKRKHHKLDEWHTFCDWIEKLPYMAELLEVDNENKTLQG